MAEPKERFQLLAENRQRLSSDRWAILETITRRDYDRAIRRAGRHIKKHLKAKLENGRPTPP